MKDDTTQNDILPTDEEETELHSCQGAAENNDSDDFFCTEVEDEDDLGTLHLMDFGDDEDEQEEETAETDSWRLRCLAGQDNAAAVEKLYIQGGLPAVREAVNNPDEGLFYRYDAEGLEIAYFGGGMREASWKRLYSYTPMMYGFLLDAERHEYVDMVDEARANGWKNPEVCARRLICLSAELGSAPAFQENRRVEYGAFEEITAAVEEMEADYQAFREGGASHE